MQAKTAGTEESPLEVSSRNPAIFTSTSKIPLKISSSIHNTNGRSLSAVGGKGGGGAGGLELWEGGYWGWGGVLKRITRST